MNFKELLIVNHHSYKDKIEYYKEILLKKKLNVNETSKKPSILTGDSFRTLFNDFVKKYK